MDIRQIITPKPWALSQVLGQKRKALFQEIGEHVVVDSGNLPIQAGMAPGDIQAMIDNSIQDDNVSDDAKNEEFAFTSKRW